jgi:hypothetical protein
MSLWYDNDVDERECLLTRMRTTVWEGSVDKQTRLMCASHIADDITVRNKRAAWIRARARQAQGEKRQTSGLILLK